VVNHSNSRSFAAHDLTDTRNFRRRALVAVSPQTVSHGVVRDMKLNLLAISVVR
jgi:hypothetical protein